MSYGTVIEGDALGRGNRQAGLGQQAQVGLNVVIYINVVKNHVIMNVV